MSDFIHLRQTGSLAKFNVKFDSLLAKLDLREEYLVDAYVGALKDEIGNSILMLNPQTMQEARKLARVQEIVTNKRNTKNTVDKNMQHVTRSSLAQPSSSTMIIIRKFLMMEAGTRTQGQDPEENEEEHSLISLHAIEGIDNSDAMQVQGYAGRQTLQILIDSGSTYDLMNPDLAKKLGWQGQKASSSFVQVAGGRRLKIQGVWNGFRWKMQGLEFTFDFRIIELHTYDIVLELKWLKSIKNSFWDYKSLSIYFWHDGQLRKLQANMPNTWKLVPPKKVELSWVHEEQIFPLQLVKFQGEELQCMAVQRNINDPPAGNSEGVGWVQGGIQRTKRTSTT